MPSAAALREQTFASSQMRKRIAADVERFVATLDFKAGWKAEAIAFCEELTLRYGDLAATVAADWFETTTSLPAVLAPELERAAVRSSAAWACNRSTDAESLSRMMAQVVGRNAVRMRQETTHASAKKHHVRWASVPQGDTCAFCIMRGSRGFDYWTEEAARASHDDCDCIPTAETVEGVEGYDPDKYLAMYDDAREGSQRATLATLREQQGTH